MCVYVCVSVLNNFLVQLGKSKYFEINRSANEFQRGILGFYFLNMCFRLHGPFQENNNVHY